MVIDPEHGTIDSPLNADQVQLVEGAGQAVAQLNRWGFTVAICTNQPSAAKGKTTLENLQKAHARVVRLIHEAGGEISGSHICFHRAEDKCSCRKPQPGLLLEALASGPFKAASSYMVGDGVTDVEAGIAAGMRTVFIGSQRCDVCHTLRGRNISPDFHVLNLAEFVKTLAKQNHLQLGSV